MNSKSNKSPSPSFSAVAMKASPSSPSAGRAGVGLPIVLGKYSPSQNGVVVSPKGIALCIAGGGKGHDTDKPKILIEYE